MQKKKIYDDVHKKTRKWNCFWTKTSYKNIDVKWVQFYGLIKKITEKTDNHKSENINRKLNNMEQVLNIKKVNDIIISKEWIEDLGNKAKSWIVRLEHLGETLKDPINICEYIIVSLFLLNVSKEKIDQVILVVLSMLAEKDIENIRAVGLKTCLKHKSLVI